MNEDSLQVVVDLLETKEPAHLGPDRRAGALGEAQVRGLVGDALSEMVVPDSHRDLVLALVLLWHDHMDASHTISQGISTGDGSFIHALMHRREPDYWNSKYWWRQTGSNPAFAEIGRAAGEHLRSANRGDIERTLVQNGRWNPDSFVEACEAVAVRSKDDPEVALMRELQQIEFRMFLSHLFGV